MGQGRKYRRSLVCACMRARAEINRCLDHFAPRGGWGEERRRQRERGSKNPPSRVNNSAQRDWRDGNSRMDWPRENDCNFFSPGYSNAILIRCARATILSMKKKRRYRRRKELRSCAYYMYVYIIGKTRRRNFVYNAIRCARMQISRSERERERKKRMRRRSLDSLDAAKCASLPHNEIT